jgi:acetyl esterase/lipase
MTMSELFLDPELTPLVASLPLADYDDVTIHQVRELTVPLFESMVGSDDVERVDPVVDANLGVKARVHRPVGRDDDLPCLVWLHGGGFVTGTYLMDGPRLDRIAARVGISIVAVEYRLAPEVPFPVPSTTASLRFVGRSPTPRPFASTGTGSASVASAPEGP